MQLSHSYTLVMIKLFALEIIIFPCGLHCLFSPPSKTSSEKFKSPRENFKSGVITYFTAARPPGIFHILCCEMHCNYAFGLPPRSHHETCIIIYCFSLSEWKEGKHCYCYFVQGARRYPIQPSYSGYTFICTVITIPCPPTTQGSEKKTTENIILFPNSTLHSFSFLLFF